MRSVFVYEFITGGGLLTSAQTPHGSLLAEGRAMVQAIVRDLVRGGVVTHVMWDARLPDAIDRHVTLHRVNDRASEHECFENLIRRCDGVLLIVPEFDRLLFERAKRVERAGGKLLSPDSRFVRWATQKVRCLRDLARGAVPVPASQLIRPHSKLPEAGSRLWPAVIKPDDGAGSQEICRGGPVEIDAYLAKQRERGFCLQPYCDGRPASVSLIARRGRTLLLPACWQHLNPRSFAYLGGATIEDDAIQRRCRRLAQAVVARMPPTNGYLGVDLILGRSPSGDDDCVMEVNPRLTTSYVGLSQAVEMNLALAMMDTGHGFCNDDLGEWSAVEFEAGGVVRQLTKQQCSRPQ